MAREDSPFAGAFVEALARSIVKRELRLTMEAQELIEREPPVCPNGDGYGVRITARWRCARCGREW